MQLYAELDTELAVGRDYLSKLGPHVRMQDATLQKRALWLEEFAAHLQSLDMVLEDRMQRLQQEEAVRASEGFMAQTIKQIIGEVKSRCRLTTEHLQHGEEEMKSLKAQLGDECLQVERLEIGLSLARRGFQVPGMSPGSWRGRLQVRDPLKDFGQGTPRSLIVSTEGPTPSSTVAATTAAGWLASVMDSSTSADSSATSSESETMSSLSALQDDLQVQQEVASMKRIPIPRLPLASLNTESSLQESSSRS